MVLTENTILVFIDHPTVLEITAHRLELLGLTVMRVGDPTDMQKVARAYTAQCRVD